MQKFRQGLQSCESAMQLGIFAATLFFVINITKNKVAANIPSLENV